MSVRALDRGVGAISTRAEPGLWNALQAGQVHYYSTPPRCPVPQCAVLRGAYSGGSVHDPGEGCFRVLPTALIVYSVDTLRVLTEHSRIRHVMLRNLGVKNAEVITACLRTSRAGRADGPSGHVTYNLFSAAHDFGRGIGLDAPKFT